MAKGSKASSTGSAGLSRAAGAGSCDAAGGRAGAKAWLAVALVTLPFLVWIVRRSILLDFWYDEVYTLDHFVFVPLRKTLTDYSDPNNHVLFSALSNLYAGLLGLPDIYEAMDEAYLLRLAPLVCALLTLVFVFKIARRVLGTAGGCFAVLVLASTVPFFHFATQIRGYSLSMLLLSVMIDRLLRFVEHCRKRDAAAATIAGALALYTIPSNLYVLLSVAVFQSIAGVGQAIRPGPVPGGRDGAGNGLRRLANRHLVAGLLMGAAVVLALGLYAPMLRDVLDNPYIRSAGLLRGNALAEILPRMAVHFVSGRVALVVLPGAALLTLLLQRKRQGAGDARLWRLWLFCLVGLVSPFAWSSLRGDLPPDRVFVTLAPLFALFVAVSAGIAARVVPSRRGLAVAALAAAGLYCYAQFGLSLREMDAHLRADIREGRRSQDTLYAYYQAYYAPLRLTFELIGRFENEPGPIFVYEYGDNAALFRYLERTRLPCFEIGDPKQIDLRPTGVAYVVTAWPQRYQARILAARPGIRCERVGPQPAFQGILVCRPAGGS